MDGSDLYITMVTMVELLNAQNLPEANIFAAIMDELRRLVEPWNRQKYNIVERA